MFVIKCELCEKGFSLASDDAELIRTEGLCQRCAGHPAPPNPKPGHKIITYKEQQFSMIRLAHGDYVILSVAKSGIELRRGLWGLFPWGRIAAWPLDKVDRFVALFGGEVNGSPFLFAVQKIASFWTIAELQQYVRASATET